MLVVKCPKCGRVCREGVVPFPRCARCQEQLLKCRYCADYDARLLDCVSPYRAEDFHIRDPDLYLACPYHRSTLSVAVARPVRRRVWMPGAALIAAALVIAALYSRIAERPRPTGPGLHARVAPMHEAFVREPMILTLDIWNPGPGEVDQVIVALDRSYEKHVALTYAEPEPLEQRRTARWERLWFSGLREGAWLEVRLHLTPIKQGTWQFRAVVMAPGMARREQVKATLEIAP